MTARVAADVVACSVLTAFSSLLDTLRNKRGDLLQRHAFLRLRVAVANRRGSARGTVVIDRDAEGGSCFVHARIALADRLFLVELRDMLLANVAEESLGDFGQTVLVHEGKHTSFHGRHARREVHVDA